MSDKTRAIIVDLDGTLALFNGRGPFEYDKCDTDLPNMPIAELVKRVDESIRTLGAELRIIIVSGRAASCMTKTVGWLNKHRIPFDDIFMPRGENDFRKDVVIKQEIYEAHLRDRYDIWFCLDDRDQVVKFWRSLGLTCLQVAEGNF